MERKSSKNKQNNKNRGIEMKKSLLIYVLFIVIITVTIVSIFRISIKINQSDIDTLKKQVKIYKLENENLRNIIEEIRLKVNSVIKIEKAQVGLLEKAPE